MEEETEEEPKEQLAQFSPPENLPMLRLHKSDSNGTLDLIATGFEEQKLSKRMSFLVKKANELGKNDKGKDKTMYG